MNKHIGSNFDEFLEEEGLLAKAEVVAIKRVSAYQVAETIKPHKGSKTVAQKDGKANDGDKTNHL